MRIIIFGGPGAGKGTMSKLLSKKYKLKHISTGDLIRDEIAKKTNLGRKLKDITKKGQLVPDSLVVQIIKRYLPKNNFILDGFPRTINQAKELSKITRIDKVIFLDAAKTTILRRLLNRYQCQTCGKIYGIDILPKKKWICDKCKIKLMLRTDDTKETILKRFRIFLKETKPVLKFYKKVLKRVDGNLKPDPMFKAVLNALK